ncbi:universal stress protein [Rhabdothermincola salaria]|uniref:universal stress protein n=1 Tax=Rhabdothermincola salaria TaxID=2903142 RepID=UPI003211C92E
MAVSWAIGEAGLRHATLVLLHVVDAELPGNPASAISYAEAVHEAADPARALIDEVTARAREALGEDADIVAEVAQGDPGQRLVEASTHADLLVVGSRGRGGIRSLVLGSVSQHCAQHAECPVVVVPPGARHES